MRMIEDRIWAVTYIAEDGHRVVAGYFRDKADADDYASGHRFGEHRVVRVSLWREGKRWYTVERREVFVDQTVLRKSALAKLTPAERHALGLE